MSRLVFFIVLMFSFSLSMTSNVSPSFAQEVDVQTQQLVGKIVSVNEKEMSFELEYALEDASGDKKISEFYVTDITTIDIAMTQAALSDLSPGMNVLVEYALMPDGARVVESIWVKNS